MLGEKFTLDIRPTFVDELDAAGLSQNPAFQSGSPFDE